MEDKNLKFNDHAINTDSSNQVTENNAKTTTNNDCLTGTESKASVYGKIKNGKPFRRWDVLIYLLLAVIVATLFLSVYLIKNKKPESTGVEFIYCDQVVFVFNFDGTYDQKVNDITVEIDKRTDNIYQLTFLLENNYDKVIRLKINLKEKSVDVLFSNCSNTKDCVYMPEIKDGVGSIICMPFDFKIRPINGEIPLVTG